MVEKRQAFYHQVTPVQLNIKNAETAQMAKELAERRRQSVARVVQDALRRELADEIAKTDAAAAARERAAGEVVRRVRGRLEAMGGSVPADGDSDGDDWLYGPDGLPR